MTDRITRTVTISTPDGMEATISDYVDVDAVGKIEKTIPKSSVPTVVDLHPLGVAVQCLVITATRYTDLTVIVGAGDPITLDGPLELMGEGLVALLGAETAEMTFTNADTEDANDITIIVGRDATAP